MTAVAVANRLVDRTDPALVAAVAADPTVRNIVAGYDDLVSPLTSQFIGSITAPLPNTAGANGQSRAGTLIADAQLRATQPVPLGAAVIAFMNSGRRSQPRLRAAGRRRPFPTT